MGVRWKLSRVRRSDGDELFLTGKQAAVQHGAFALEPVSHLTHVPGDVCADS